MQYLDGRLAVQPHLLDNRTPIGLLDKLDVRLVMPLLAPPLAVQQVSLVVLRVLVDVVEAVLPHESKQAVETMIADSLPSVAQLYLPDHFALPSNRSACLVLAGRGVWHRVRDPAIATLGAGHLPKYLLRVILAEEDFLSRV